MDMDMDMGMDMDMDMDMHVCGRVGYSCAARVQRV